MPFQPVPQPFRCCNTMVSISDLSTSIVPIEFIGLLRWDRFLAHGVLGWLFRTVEEVSILSARSSPIFAKYSQTRFSEFLVALFI